MPCKFTFKEAPISSQIYGIVSTLSIELGNDLITDTSVVGSERSVSQIDIDKGNTRVPLHFDLAEVKNLSVEQRESYFLGRLYSSARAAKTLTRDEMMIISHDLARFVERDFSNLEDA